MSITQPRQKHTIHAQQMVTILSQRDNWFGDSSTQYARSPRWTLVLSIKPVSQTPALVTLVVIASASAQPWPHMQKPALKPAHVSDGEPQRSVVSLAPPLCLTT